VSAIAAEPFVVSATRPRMILDCDPGLDDAVAIAVALRWADVVGITTVGGNVALDRTTANALALCDLLGRPDVPVHAGHDMPLNGSIAHRATEYHGPFGTGSVRFAPPSRGATSDDAVAWLIETITAETDLWLVATGPLTNVARAVQRVPRILDGLRGISWMGGSSTCGNTTAAAEFNCWVDPEAADIVIRASHPQLSMVGLNVTHTVLVDQRWIDELRALTSGTAMEVFSDLLAYYEQQQRSLTTLAGAAVHDALAVMRVTHPSLLGGVRRPVQVVTGDGPTRGMTLVDQRPRRHPDPAIAEVIEWANADALRNVLMQTLAGT
jgi:inosine-uridine nucleoside N-ribohydrolase